MIDLTPIARLSLLLVRPGMLFVAAPAFGGAFAPAPVKIGLTVMIAMALAPVTALPHADTMLALLVIVAREAAIGLGLALAIRSLIAAAELAGQLTGFQMGLSYSATVDPQSGVRNALMTTLYANLALITFFLINGHHAFVRALYRSYEMLPVGPGAIDRSLPDVVVHMLGLIFTLGVRLAAPVIVVLVIVEIGLALIARSAPALNVLAMGPSVRAIVGLVLVAATVASIVGVISGTGNRVLELAYEAARAFR